MTKLDCGDTCPRTGAYRLVDGRGKVLNTIYVSAGETMPPAEHRGCHYETGF